MRCTCLTLGALLAAIAAFACRDQPPQPPPPPPPPPHDGVTLIQPGATPRQVLRYHLTRGTKVTSQLECDADVKSPELATAMPTQVIQLETAVDDVLADGAAKLRITIIDATVRERTPPPAIATANGGSANAAPTAAASSPEQPSNPQPSNPQPSNGRPATKATPHGRASIAEAAMGDASGGDPATGPGANSAADAAAAHSGAAIAGAASSGAGGSPAVRGSAVSSGALGGGAAGGAAAGKPPNTAAATPHSPPGEVSIDVMRAQAAAMRGVVITETLAPDGSVSDAHIEGGAATDKIRSELDALLHSLEHVATRLPSEPVGLGAIWRERRTLPEGGVRAVSEITYTLASITGSALGFTSTGTSAGDAQTIEQDGTKLEVSDTHGSSTASGTVDLARYAMDVVTSSSFATTMKEVAAAAGPGSGKSTIEIAMAIRLASAPAAITAAAPGAPPAAGDTSPTAAAPTAAAPTVAAPTAAAPTAAAPTAAAPTGTASPATEHGTR